MARDSREAGTRRADGNSWWCRSSPPTRRRSPPRATTRARSRSSSSATSTRSSATCAGASAPARAEELAAETFAQALAARRRYDTAHADARPWLYGIAVNLLRRHYRDEERALRAYARSGADPLVADEPSLAGLDAAAMGPAVAAAPRRAPPIEREALLLYAWADLGYGEIAAALGIPVGTVRSRLSRARARVRELLAAERAIHRGNRRWMRSQPSQPSAPRSRSGTRRESAARRALDAGDADAERPRRARPRGFPPSRCSRPVA